MTISVTHTTQATGTDAGNGEIRKAQWNEAHTVSGVPDIVAQSAVTVSAGAVTTEVTLATITIPANAMGANGCIEIWTGFTVTNNANNKTIRIRVGGAAGTAIFDSTDTTFASNSRPTLWMNANSTSSQRTMGSSGQGGGVGWSGGSAVTSSVDTTASFDIVITGQKANSADTLTLHFYRVTLYKKD